MQVLLFARHANDGRSAVLQSYLGLFAREERDDLSHRGQIIQLFREARTPLYCYLVCMGMP